MAILAVLPFVLILLVVGGGSTTGGTQEGVIYVEHWSNGDAYTHHFLHQRYGITSEQIDGFIRSQGYDPVGRASGKAFLEAQAKSGIDVRVLVAFAQMESAYGTAGVARQYPEANIWGYGCVDNDPNQGRHWGPERAFSNFRSYQIEQLGNSTLQIMDERARQNANGTLPEGKGVYYTSVSDTGKKRASVMEALDKYIDENGGTPKAPSGTSTTVSGGGRILMLDALLGQYIGSGQCYALTSYYSEHSGGARMLSFQDVIGDTINAYAIGSGWDWSARGWVVIHNPKASEIRSGDIINWKPFVPYTADSPYTTSQYGHTAVVGEVKENGEVMVYDQNPTPNTYHAVKVNDTMLSSLVRKGN